MTDYAGHTWCTFSTNLDHTEENLERHRLVLDAAKVVAIRQGPLLLHAGEPMAGMFGATLDCLGGVSYDVACNVGTAQSLLSDALRGYDFGLGHSTFRPG